MNREQIETLLNLYLDGDTTNEEEQLLRQYFATTQVVPTEWKAYQALFKWEVSQQHPANLNGTPQTLRPSRRYTKYRLAIAASLTTLVLVGAGITAMLLRHSGTEQLTAQNYAILDGRYTTDANIIAREAEEALLMVSATDEETFDAIDILAIP